MEIYKDIAGYEGVYQNSEFNVKSLKFGKERILKPAIDSRGYFTVTLCLNGKQKTHGVHRLIAKAFIPNPEHKPQINHINGIKTDNRVENLEWCSCKENIRHAWDTGLSVAVVGENAKNAKLTDKEILEIRASPVYRGSQKTLRKKYGISNAHICRIINRERRTNI